MLVIEKENSMVEKKNKHDKKMFLYAFYRWKLWNLRDDKQIVGFAWAGKKDAK